MDFHEWISKKFLEWRKDKIGKGSSITDFGRLFGASHQVVTNWMSKDGDIPRSQKYINALIQVYGDEVYDILGLERPSEGPVSKLPPALKSRIESAAAEINSIYAARGISADSPEAAEIASEVFEKYGFIVKDIIKSGN